MTGNSEGRVIKWGTVDFRVFSAGQEDTATGAVRRCVVIAQEAFDLVAKELAQALSLRASLQTDQEFSWKHLVNVGGRWRSLDRMSVQEIIKLPKGNPIIQIAALKSGDGVALFYAEQSFRRTPSQ
jgi:hypothetical protein